MTEYNGPPPGAIGWWDLTVADAEGIRSFYEAVIGWRSEPVDMGDYQDFNMIIPSTGDTTAGICHARGGNSNIPSQWMIYIAVEDVTRSVEKCKELGGQVVDGPRDMGGGRYCIVRDPAGAVSALFQPPADEEDAT